MLTKLTFISLIVLMIGCAINPHTGSPVITLGRDIVWDFDSAYSYQSNNIANDLVVILASKGYSIESISKDPLLIRTESTEIGDPWTEGIQIYRLSITAFGENRFLLRIEPRNMMAPAYDPDPPLADGILQAHYNRIMNPLEEAFASREWKKESLKENE